MMSRMLTAEEARAAIDGAVMPLDGAALALSDAGVARGDGVFETVGVWDGRPFRLSDHLDRLDASLRAMALPEAPRAEVEADVAAVLDGVRSDAALRIYMTASGTRVATISPLPDRAEIRTLRSQPAPWISPVATYAAAGAKSMSYAPNMTATRRAVLEGSDDALLVSVPDGYVLEGPTFGVVFVARDVVHVPDAALGIIDSISRRTLVEVADAAGLDVITGRWPLEALAEADEVVICSSLRGAVAVRQVDGWSYPDIHPVAALLDAGLQERRRG